VASPHLPQQNHLLAALPAEVKGRLFPHLELVPLPLGKVLYESGDALRHVYFPTDSIVSLLYVMEDGDSAEIAERPGTAIRPKLEQLREFPLERYGRVVCRGIPPASQDREQNRNDKGHARRFCSSRKSHHEL